MTNWDDPADRARLIERVGIAEYNRLHAEHVRRSAVACVTGYRIRPVASRFGRLFMVDGTGTAFASQQEAEDFARKRQPGPHAG